jgi:hypothetical protein
MASWLTLELDTTPPNVEIYSPTYLAKDSTNQIEIVADEVLAKSGHNIYTVDANRIIRPLNLTYDNNKLYGNIDVYDYPVGQLYIFAQLLDDVFNTSILYSKTVNVVNNLGKMKLNLSTANTSTNISSLENLVNSSIATNEPKISIES